ncbi:MAG: YiiX/YebB-like N1pC/P60 family cysteine hydrolase [Candidatus Eremiobacterota bacterium]
MNLVTPVPSPPPSPVRPARPLPVAADQFRPSTPEAPAWVSGADRATYVRTGATLGAATLSFASHFAMPAAGAWAGVTLASSALGHPVATVVGGLVGAFAAHKLQSKTLIGRHLGGYLGAGLGATVGVVAHALRIPLRSDHVEESSGFRWSKLPGLLGTTSATSHPHMSEAEADAFMARLKPGDIVLTNDEACTPFSLIVALVDGKADYNHALLYIGDGRTIESRTVTHGVAEGNLKKQLLKKHHAVAIRPHYEAGQAEQVVEAGRAQIGIAYDYRFRMGDNAMYCSEQVYKALKQGAPQIEFKRWPLITREVVLPGDFLRTSQADVVAEAGVDRTLVNSYLAKFS